MYSPELPARQIPIPRHFQPSLFSSNWLRSNWEFPLSPDIVTQRPELQSESLQGHLIFHFHFPLLSRKLGRFGFWAYRVVSEPIGSTEQAISVAVVKRTSTTRFLCQLEGPCLSGCLSERLHHLYGNLSQAAPAPSPQYQNQSTSASRVWLLRVSELFSLLSFLPCHCCVFCLAFGFSFDFCFCFCLCQQRAEGVPGVVEPVKVAGIPYSILTN